MKDNLPEAWLRGPVAGVDPLVAPLLYTFQAAREDLALVTEGLTTDQIWARPGGITSLGFHLHHIAGSVDRLTTYLAGSQLSDWQVAEMRSETEPLGASREELLSKLEGAFRNAGKVIRAVDPASFAEPRAIGRKQLPTTVLGLMVHIAEHTGRHVGEALVAARLARGQTGRAAGEASVPNAAHFAHPSARKGHRCVLGM